MIRLAHVWSADLGLALSLEHLRPLLDRGWEVFGICPPGPRIPEIQRAGVRWLEHPLERKLVARSDLRALASLYRTFREHRFHIVHTHNAKVGIVGRLVAAAAGVPVVVHTHNGLIYSLESPFAERYAVAALERAASEVAGRVFVQSPDDYETLVATGGAHPRVLDLVGNGVDMRRFDPARFDARSRAAVRRALGVADSDVLFFSAGRMVREKGFVELFEAYEQARRTNPAVRLAIAGPSDTERGLGIDAATIRRAEGAGALLLGERSDMPELYAAADVVVLPSWREGVPRVLMEGAAMGKALIASDARGCRSFVRPGWGFVTPCRDVSALTKAMLRLASDADSRAAIGMHNREAARREYDLERLLARVSDTYVELLQRKGIDPRTVARPGQIRLDSRLA